MQHQEHFGRKFYLDKKTGYWISTDYPRIRAHVWVWVNEKGEIPEGFHIHHIDENKSNNSIENLLCISQSEHMQYHMKDEDRRNWARNWCEVIRPLTKKWHRSEEGIDWHKKHAERFGFGKWDKVEKKCEQCCVLYKTSKRSNCRFCSNSCKSAWRRKEKLDDIDVPCVACGSIFKRNKYAKRKYCDECRIVGRPRKISKET